MKVFIRSLFIIMTLALSPLPNVWAQSYIPGSVAPLSYCPHCGPSFFQGPSAGILPYSMPMGAPWWYPYGALSYNNFRYPSPWGGYGIMPQHYPGYGPFMQGGGFMGKPNVYIDADVGTELHIEPVLKNMSNLLAAIPRLGKSGWTVKVQGAYDYRVENVSYTHLFYDFRFSPKILQEKSGYCGNPQDSLAYMTRTLQDLGFSAYEVKDFETYWAVKLPPAKQYCIFPQGNQELDQAVEVKIKNLNPKDNATIEFKRIGFMVVIQNQEDRHLVLNKKPSTPWKEKITGQRKPAGQKTIVIREWGVGFLSQ